MKRSIGDFEIERDHAAWAGIDPKTLRRYRNRPDGLPYTTAGKVILYKREWTLAWLESRRQVNNPIAALSRRDRRRGS